MSSSSVRHESAAAFAATGAEHELMLHSNGKAGSAEKNKDASTEEAALDENWLIKNGTTQRPAKGESNSGLLRRLTHLNLQDKKLVFVDNESFKPVSYISGCLRTSFSTGNSLTHTHTHIHAPPHRCATR